MHEFEFALNCDSALLGNIYKTHRICSAFYIIKFP